MRISLKNLDSPNQSASGIVVGLGVVKCQQTQQEELPFFQKRFCSFGIMARVWSLGVLFSVSIIIILIILGGSMSTNGQRNRTRQVVRRRRITTTTTIPPPTIVEPPQIFAPLSISIRNEDFFQSTTSDPNRNDTQQDDGDEVANVSNPIPVADNVYNIRGRAGDVCPEKCERENCPLIGQFCTFGHVLDQCSCCFVCGVGEGSRCYNSSTPELAYSPDDGICGNGLLCLDRVDLELGESPEALCECRNTRKVCGSDNITYSSECKLREAAHYNPSLGIVSWSPCVSAPWLTTSMENVTGGIGTDVSMSCEFRSYPASIIHWEFSPEGLSERMILPGDDSAIIQTNRGGPEEMMTTSFLQILSVTPMRQGTYYCVATNNEGITQSYGIVSIYKKSTT